MVLAKSSVRSVLSSVLLGAYSSPNGMCPACSSPSSASLAATSSTPTPASSAVPAPPGSKPARTSAPPRLLGCEAAFGCGDDYCEVPQDARFADLCGHDFLD